MPVTGDISLRIPQRDDLDSDVRSTLETNFGIIAEIIAPLNAGQGATDTFIAGAKTVTVVNGVITSIV